MADDHVAFVPTDADVESLAACLYATWNGYDFATARGRLSNIPSELKHRWHQGARAAFGHAGYLSSVMAARQDAKSTAGDPAPDTARLIDSITRLIKVAHEVSDGDLMQTGVRAVKLLIDPGFVEPSA